MPVVAAAAALVEVSAFCAFQTPAVIVMVEEVASYEMNYRYYHYRHFQHHLVVEVSVAS